MIFQKVFCLLWQVGAALLKNACHPSFSSRWLFFKASRMAAHRGTETITAMTAFTPEVTAYVATERSTGPKALPSSIPSIKLLPRYSTM